MLLWLLVFAPVVGVAVTAILAANATQSARDVGEDAAPRGWLATGAEPPDTLRPRSSRRGRLVALAVCHVLYAVSLCALAAFVAELNRQWGDERPGRFTMRLLTLATVSVLPAALLLWRNFELDRMAPPWWFVWVVTWGQVSLVAFVFLRAAYLAQG